MSLFLLTNSQRIVLSTAESFFIVFKKLFIFSSCIRGPYEEIFRNRFQPLGTTLVEFSTILLTFILGELITSFLYKRTRVYSNLKKKRFKNWKMI